jgi:hypothetical protein
MARKSGHAAVYITCWPWCCVRTQGVFLSPVFSPWKTGQNIDVPKYVYFSRLRRGWGGGGGGGLGNLCVLTPLKSLSSPHKNNPIHVYSRTVIPFRCIRASSRSHTVYYGYSHRGVSATSGHSHSEAEFLDEIQTEVLRVFLLAIHSHFYSFALRFMFFQTHATSYSFKSSVTEHCKEENHTPFTIWFKKSLQKLQVWELSKLCLETSTTLYVHEFVFWCIFKPPILPYRWIHPFSNWHIWYISLEIWYKNESTPFFTKMTEKCRRKWCDIPSPREYWMITEGQPFSLSYNMAPRPPLAPPSPVIKLERRHTGSQRDRDNLIRGDLGEGVGEEPNHMTARKPGPL